MKLTTLTTLFLTAKEAKAIAAYFDKYSEVTVAISGALGADAPDVKLSFKEKLGVAMGKTVTKGEGAIKIEFAKPGVTVKVEVDEQLPPEVITEYLSAVSDVIDIIMPAVTGSIKSFKAAGLVAEKRIKSAAAAITKALSKES